LPNGINGVIKAFGFARCVTYLGNPNKLPMKFEYQLTQKDLSDFSEYYYWKKKKVSVVLNALIIAFAFLFFLNRSGREINIILAIACFSIGLVAYVFIIQNQLRSYGKNFKVDCPLLAKKQVEITDEHYGFVDEFEEGKIKWRAFDKVEIGKHAIYLFMGSPFGVIIPKSAFENEARITEFVNYVTERIKLSAPMGLSF
jgi:hypothetical protein